MTEPIKKSEKMLKLTIETKMEKIYNLQGNIKEIEAEIEELRLYCEHRVKSEANYDGDEQWRECKICKAII